MTDQPENNIISFPQTEETSALIHFDRAKRELELAASIDEVKKIREQAEALRQYARQQKLSLEMQNRCAEFKIRAERRAGEILSGMDKHPPGPSSGDRSHDGTDLPRLVDLGISKNQSSLWQSVASIPEDEFESRVDDISGNSWFFSARGTLSLPRDSAVDPCCGSGTVAVACKWFNRGIIGCDVDEHGVNETRKRVFEQ